VLSAIVVAVLIAWLGLTALRAASGVGLDIEPQEPEDVDDLEVYLVCRECGTEFRVTRLGELQIPRHCGERMEVVRRPAGAGASFHRLSTSNTRFRAGSPGVLPRSPSVVHTAGGASFTPVDGVGGNHIDVIPGRYEGDQRQRVAATNPAPITPRPIHSQCCCVPPGRRKLA